jgi:hypothetical protein
MLVPVCVLFGCAYVHMCACASKGVQFCPRGKQAGQGAVPDSLESSSGTGRDVLEKRMAIVYELTQPAMYWLRGMHHRRSIYGS